MADVAARTPSTFGLKEKPPQEFVQAAFGLIVAVIAFIIFGRYGTNFALSIGIVAIAFMLFRLAPKAGFVALCGGLAWGVVNYFNFRLEWSLPVIAAATLLGICWNIEPLRDFAGKALVFLYTLAGSIAIFFLGALAMWKWPVFPPEIVSIFVFTLLIVYYLWLIFEKKTKMSFVIAILQVLVLAYIVFTAESTLVINSPFYEAAVYQRETWMNAYEWVTNVPDVLIKSFERSWGVLHGEYELSVEEGSERPLGVFLDNIQVTSPRVTTDQPVVMLAKLRAEAFKTAQQLRVKLNCYPRSDPQLFGEVSPIDTISIVQFEQRQVTCTFNPGVLKPGNQQLVFEATFDFVTGAYQKAYFMEEKRKRGLAEQGRDPLQGISEKYPITVHSQGPLRIAIGVDEQPVSLMESAAQGTAPGPTISVQLENNWLGEFVALKNLKIGMPNGLVIATVGGYPVSQEGIECSQQDNTCTVSGELLRRMFPVDTLKASSIPIPVSTRIGPTYEEGVRSLLAGQPLGFGTIIVEAQYEYRIKREAQVLVRPAQVQP